MSGTRICSVFAVLAAVVLSVSGTAASTAASATLPTTVRPMMGCCFVAI
ncbi:MAG TPA: hypothetical protein VFP72_16235 [Kineosporiaceae bacterium]|nr:hypothetical protein [Kineosporiaceae bacterium]